MGSLVSLVSAVLLLRVGLAMYVVGLTRSKNAAGNICRLVADLGLAVLCAYVVGGAVVNRGESPIGLGLGHLTLDLSSFTTEAGANAVAGAGVFAVLAAVASGIAVGPVAERSRFAVVVMLAVVTSAVSAPLLYLWTGGGGWLGRLRFADHGFGWTWVHVAGGAAALVAAKLVGPRDNKYHRDGSASVIPGHSLPLAGIGALLMFAALAMVHAVAGPLLAVNTVLAGAAGAVASLVYGQTRYGKPDLLLMLAGMLGAAAAMTGAGIVTPAWAMVIGAVAGVIVPWTAVTLDLKWHVDDPTSAIAIHLVGGGWGVVAAGPFGGRPWAELPGAVGVQLLGLVVIVVVAGAVTLAALKLIQAKLRSKEADEFDGLDLAEHDVGAYPDFQQNSIRSYHLREA